MKYTTILLDFDDTLIDTQGYAEKCLRGIYTDYNISTYYPTFEDFIEVYSKNTHHLWELYALGEIDKRTLIDKRFYKPFEQFSTVSREYLDEMNKDFMTRVVHIDYHIDGAKELLEYLKPKYKIVMLSNGFTELQYDKLESVGFTKYFDEVVLSDVVGVNKPHPGIFNFAMNKVGANIEETIMIGDNYLADIKGAMDSNIDQIWYNPNSLNGEEKPTFTVKTLQEIAQIL